ncbi:MAG: penicillin-binding transpeptidase domain-containing protein [Acidobacteriota bacterium]
MRRIAFLALSTFLAGAAAAPAASAEPVERDFSRHFGKYEGCFASQRLGSDELQVHNLALCREPLAPCSTFKMPNTLIGLESGVIPDADFVLPWDGTRHSRSELNQDHTLRSAVQQSVLWYFQELARRVGEERMREYVTRLGYGNRDTSGGLTEFWLSSSLEVTALEQMGFLARLHRDALPVSKRSMAILRDILVIDESPEAVLRGKTGSCLDNAGACCSHGWFVGSVTRGEEVYLFASFVKGAWSGEARPVALAILEELGILPGASTSEGP